MAKVGRPKGEQKMVQCEECGDYFDPDGNRKKRFCSHDCVIAHNRRIYAWKRKMKEAERFPKAKSVIEMNLEAKANGMNYGDYVAKQYLEQNRIVRKW